HGLKSGDYDFVYAGATTARAQALLSGAVDAALLLPPSNFQVQAAGYNDLGLTVEYAPELPFSGTAVNKAWAGRNQDVLRRGGGAPAQSNGEFFGEHQPPRRGWNFVGGGTQKRGESAKGDAFSFSKKH